MITGKWMRRGEEVVRELLLAKEQVERLYSEYNKRNEKLSSVCTEAMLLMSLKVEELYAFRNEHADETSQRSINAYNHKVSTPDNGVRRISSSGSPKKRKKGTLSKEKRLSRSDSLIGANATSDADGNNKTVWITKLIEAVKTMDDKRRVWVTAALSACFYYTRRSSSTYEINKQDGNVNANVNAIVNTSANMMNVLSNVDKVKSTRNLSYALINKTTSSSPLTSPQRSNGNSPRNAPLSLETEIATTTTTTATGNTSTQEARMKATGELGGNLEVDNITENRNSVDIISMTESSNVKSNTATKEFRRPREVPREAWNDMLELRQQKLKLEDSIAHILHELRLQIARFELLQKNLRVIEYAQVALVCDNHHQNANETTKK